MTPKKRRRPAVGKMSKVKGKRGELEAASKLGELLGAPIARSQQYKGNTDAGDRILLLLHRRNCHPGVAVVYLDDLVDVVEAVQQL